MQVIQYEHHGKTVSVIDSLKGKHKEFCLCYTGCKYFRLGAPDHCEIAQAVYENCVRFGITTPIWECPKYENGL